MNQWFISLIEKYDGYGFLLYITLTVFIAGVLSSVIGLEREFKGQVAGLRTHVLVTLGCSLLMSISIYGIRFAIKDSATFSTLNYDAARIGAGILGGVGFIGAGTIIKNGISIRGLTTAATMWLCSAIGMACGCGLIIEAIAVTGIAMFFLVGLSFVERWLDYRAPKVLFIVAPNVPLLHEIRTEADHYRLNIKAFESNTVKMEDGKEAVEIKVHFAFRSDKAAIADFVEKFHSYPYIYKVAAINAKQHNNEA